MLPQLKKFLTHIVEFTDDDLEVVWGFFEPKKIKKGDYLCVPGNIATEVGFLIKGAFRIYYLIDEKESTRFIGSEGIFVTSIPSFTTQKPCVEYVQAMENMDLLMLSYDNLQKMFLLSPKWERFVRILAEYSYNEQQSRIYSLIALTAQQRYEQFIKQRPDLVQRIPQYIIANYLGISPETLSRIRKN